MQFRMLPHLDQQGDICGLTGIGEDLRLRQTLKTQEAMAERIMNSTIEGILVTDARARIQRVNPAFTQITGYTAEEVIGKTPKFLRSNHHEQSFYDLMNRALLQAGNWQGEIWNRRKSGELYLQWMSVSALHEHEGGEITHFVSIFHDLTEIRAKEAEIEQLAFRDPLTGLGNRYKLNQVLKHQLRDGRADQCTGLALLCIDIGHLYPINDRFGMKGGDQLIKYQARRLSQRMGQHLHFYRVTGDELVALRVDFSDPSEIARYAGECIKHLQEPVFLNGESIRMSPSIGIALSPKDTCESDVLLANAQTAMLAAKHSGRDCFQFYDQALSSELRQRLMLEQELRLAIESGARMGLQLYLQPKVNLGRPGFAGAEVLLRWQHPEKGMIPPAHFIPLAEESRLIVQLDRWVFERTCELLNQWQQQGVLAHWQQQGWPLPLLSINLSGRQLQQTDLVNWCTATVERYGLVPGMLELEITETACINLSATVLEQLLDLKAVGFRLALDDFGTGYSSLTYLRHLPLDVVKIDRSFVTDSCRNKRAATLLRGVIRMLHEMDFRVIAEGIETEEQADLLQSMECTTGQGYLYHRPMPVAEFLDLLRTEH
ncbi:hypothetical protein GCM10009104_23860 [Marinobacterium maritimum]|uniref:PAS domain S-box-containing protein/diguanylate cyclase (GGDEF) domain-containing protein n=2 Tax=Marinobacterium maritimum TaxID=500162 RepID=A0ABP3TD04_9GAMM